MTGEVRPVGAVQRRERERRTVERRAGSASRALVPVDVPAEPAEPPARPAPTPPGEVSAAAFAAQVYGQTGQRRGLKGGPPVLDAARSSYLGANYSGGAERRPKPGKATDTDI